MNQMPLKSYTSRSCQSAAAQMDVIDGTSGNSPGLSSFQRGSITFSTRLCFFTMLEMWYTTSRCGSQPVLAAFLGSGSK